MIQNINAAKYVIARVTDICEFLINKDAYQIIQTQKMSKQIEEDITNKCLNLSCEYHINSLGEMCINYKIGNILSKILNNAVDMDCIQFFADNNFDIEFFN